MYTYSRYIYFWFVAWTFYWIGDFACNIHFWWFYQKCMNISYIADEKINFVIWKEVYNKEKIYGKH